MASAHPAPDQTVSRALPWYMDEARIPAKLAAIADGQVRHYATLFMRDGFVAIPDAVSAGDCDAALADFRALEARNPAIFAPHVDADGHYPRIINLHLALPSLRRLFHANRIALAVQDAMFERPTSLYTSLFYERGSGQPMHRDTPYFCTRPEYLYFGMWVPLEDVDADNGPLMVMPGGHKLPELDREAIAHSLHGGPDNQPAASDESWVTYQDEVTRTGLAQGLEITTLPVAKGSTILWHPQLPHGGAPIGDIARTRFSLVMHTTPEGMPVYHQDAFFNPDRWFPEIAHWGYLDDGDRRFVDHGVVGVGHGIQHPSGSFA